jgi:hypothetical protein
MSSTHLLGPQRFLTTAGAVVRSLGVEGSVATVTAGWEERESDDGELDSVLEGRSRNLRLFGRMMDVLERDPDVAAAALALRDGVDDLSGAYSVRLHHALDSVYAVRRRKGRDDVLTAAYEDGIEAVRRLDLWYLDEVRELYNEAYATGAADRSELWAQHRTEVSELLAGSSVLAVAGGHVGMLLRTMQFFSVRPPAELPVVAWSAGAMAMTRMVVLFNDFTQSHAAEEVWDRGVGRVDGVIALPHARRRIMLEDRVRTQVFVRRFQGYACLLLDDGAKVAVGPDGSLPAGARVLRADGTVGVVEAAA